MPVDPKKLINPAEVAVRRRAVEVEEQSKAATADLNKARAEEIRFKIEEKKRKLEAEGQGPDLFGVGAALVGDALGKTKEEKQLFTTAGLTIGKILQDRFEAKQAEDFIGNELAQFQQASNSFHEQVGAVEDPDQMAQMFSQWKDSVFMPFMNNAAGRYPKNKRIMEIVRQIDDANKKGLDEFIKPSSDLPGQGTPEGGDEFESERMEKAQKLEKGEASIGYTKALTGQAQMNTWKASPEGQMFSRLTGATIPINAPPAIQRDFVRQMPEKEAKPIDDQTRERAASNLIAAYKRNQTLRPDGQVWGKTGNEASDKQLALEEVMKSSNYDLLIEGSRIAATLGPQALDNFGGLYDAVKSSIQGTNPVLLPEELAESTKLRGEQDPATILSVILAQPKENVTQYASIEDFISTVEEMEDPAQLGPSFARTFDAAVFSDHKVLKNSYTRQPIKTWDELQQALREDYKNRILVNRVSNDAASRRTLKQAAAIGEAGIQRFGPEIAKKFGINVPPPPKSFFEMALDQMANTFLSAVDMPKIGQTLKDAPARLLPAKKNRKEVLIGE